jgi:hypothetical protein
VSDTCFCPYLRLFCTWTVDARIGRAGKGSSLALAHAGPWATHCQDDSLTLEYTSNTTQDQTGQPALGLLPFWAEGEFARFPDQWRRERTDHGAVTIPSRPRYMAERMITGRLTILATLLTPPFRLSIFARFFREHGLAASWPMGTEFSWIQKEV